MMYKFERGILEVLYEKENTRLIIQKDLTVFCTNVSIEDISQAYRIFKALSNHEDTI